MRTGCLGSNPTPFPRSTDFINTSACRRSQLGGSLPQGGCCAQRRKPDLAPVAPVGVAGRGRGPVLGWGFLAQPPAGRPPQLAGDRTLPAPGQLWAAGHPVPSGKQVTAAGSGSASWPQVSTSHPFRFPSSAPQGSSPTSGPSRLDSPPGLCPRDLKSSASRIRIRRFRVLTEWGRNVDFGPLVG